jgi:hypothetical protein
MIRSIQLKEATWMFSFALALFALSSEVQAAPQVSPGPDGCYPAFTTAEGCNALAGLASGQGNTGVGWYALFSAGDSSFSTGLGGGALALNSADSNTAVGAAALLLTTTGGENVAVGTDALVVNDSGFDDNAVGYFALSSNTTGDFNNAHGRGALEAMVDGGQNNAFGDLALADSVDDSGNSAFGDDALDSVNGGSENVGVGDEAGNSLLDGSFNVCLGANAGIGIVHASHNIAIGVEEAGPFTDFDNTCFIGSIFGEPVSDPGSQVPVYVDQFNVVGIFNSSRQYKHDITPMGDASETLYRLKPVTFKFNSDVKGTTQYGLIAEEVADVDPQLVARRDGEIVSVHYEQINAMLLNEFLKEHRKVEEQGAIIARQQKQIDALASGLQKVSTQLELSKSTPQTVLNDR